MVVARRSVVALTLSSLAAVMVSVRPGQASWINPPRTPSRYSMRATRVPARLARGPKAVLVFRRIYKGGLLIGGQTGNGVLLIGGRAAGYYNISTASYWRARVQLCPVFMTDAALSYLERSHGWTGGSGPNVVVVNRGAAKSLTSATLERDVYAFPFGTCGPGSRPDRFALNKMSPPDPRNRLQNQHPQQAPAQIPEPP